MFVDNNSSVMMTMQIEVEPYQRMDIHFNKTCVQPK
jgi:hypothetical protein